jgi:hypothetical protein
MNPVDEVDDLLTRAGARWRADQDPPPEPDLAYLTSGGRNRRRWVPALAAASVAAVAAGVIAVLPGAKPPATTQPQTFANGNQAPYGDLLVHDGDEVTASGYVIVEAGQDSVFCPPLPHPMPLRTGGAELQTLDCPTQYRVNLKNFTGASGAITVTGTWSGRTIDVRTQTVPEVRSTTAELRLPPDEVPCQPPAAGWSTAPNVIDKAAVSKFLSARENQAGSPEWLFPKGRVPGAPEVFTIGVAHGDLAAFQRDFEKVYSGNLCVHQTKYSEAELNRKANEVMSLIPNGLGVYGGGGTAGDKLLVQALVYDDALKNALTPLGLDDLDLNVAIRPLH